MGLDFFSPSAGGEAYDPAAFERFKEQMKKNAKFVATQQKSEQRQKKKEDALLQILMRFFKSNKKRGLVVLASRLLEQNIPASFILGVILLGNEDLQREVRESAPLLESPAGNLVNVSIEPISPPQTSSSEFSLVAAFSDPSIPLRVKAEIDAWGKNLYEIVSANPFRILETVLDPAGMPKSVVINCMANVLQDYLFENGLVDYSYETMASFSEFLIHGILKKAKEQVEGQKLVKE